jgi:hypothetical protein
MQLTFGSLFAGIGGFDLGFERAGMRCAWQVEIAEFPSRVLAKHWPNVRRWDDVRTFPPAGDWSVDVICGGDPCQENSAARTFGNVSQQSLGGESDLPLSRLVTLCCPSDSEPVALGLSTSATDCSCSPSFPTPTATDWKGGKRYIREGFSPNFRDWWMSIHGRTYPHELAITAAMGFPATWTWLRPPETPSSPKSPNGSADES